MCIGVDELHRLPPSKDARGRRRPGREEDMDQMLARFASVALVLTGLLPLRKHVYQLAVIVYDSMRVCAYSGS